MEVSSQGDGGGRGGYYVRVPPGELIIVVSYKEQSQC